MLGKTSAEKVIMATYQANGLNRKAIFIQEILLFCFI